MECDKLKKITTLIILEQELKTTTCSNKDDLEEFLFQLKSVQLDISCVKEFQLALVYKEELEELKNDYAEYAIVSIIDTQLRELESKLNIMQGTQTPASREASFKKSCEVDGCNGFLYVDYHHENPFLKCSSGIYEHKRRLTDSEKEYFLTGKI